ncbi:hypothetical protein M433DRAFT_4369 [Acidomyces richmondensis BFW]|nr:hypothetical protein M433DRAFT_4369 [Acidomyces richmondensis BFW]
MADRLTQLQDAIDNQMTLMYAAINYIQRQAPYGHIEGQPSQAPSMPDSAGPQSAVSQSQTQHPNGNAVPQVASSHPPSSPPPDAPDVFNTSLRELAQSLVLQEQQIEFLINSLPGLGNSEESQRNRIRELEKELREVEDERKKAEVERDLLVDVLGEVIVRGSQRIP